MELAELTELTELMAKRPRSDDFIADKGYDSEV